MKKEINPVASHFESLWEHRPVQYHAERSIQFGVSYFLDLSKMNREDLAKRLFKTQSQVVNIQSRGRPAGFAVLTRLAELCHDYRFFDLEKLFRDRIMDIRAKGLRKK